MTLNQIKLTLLGSLLAAAAHAEEDGMDPEVELQGAREGRALPHARRRLRATRGHARGLQLRLPRVLCRAPGLHLRLPRALRRAPGLHLRVPPGRERRREGGVGGRGAGSWIDDGRVADNRAAGSRAAD